MEANSPNLWRAALPWPGPDAHKHARGRLGVVSGGPLNTGAARLAARAGLRVGAGLVRLLCPPDAGPIVAGAVEAIMVDVFSTPAELYALANPLQSVVIGPAAGLGPDTERHVAALARGSARLVVDADALSTYKGRAGELFGLLRTHDILTPHEGEFERLFPGLLGKGWTEAALKASRESGTHLVLKAARL